MQSLSDDERKAVLGEVLSDELKVITEYVKDIPKIKLKVDKLEKLMDQALSDIITNRFAITETNQQVKDHELRITAFEAA